MLNVIKYWQTLEYLSPNSVPKASPGDRQAPCLTVREGDRLIWEKEGQALPSIEYSKKWCFQLYGCVYDFNTITLPLIEKHFGRDTGYQESSNRSLDTCLYYFEADPNGRPLFDTFMILDSAVALADLAQGNPRPTEWIDFISAFSESVKEEFMDRFEFRPEDDEANDFEGVSVGRSLTCADLQEYSAWMLKELKLSPDEFPINRIQCKKISIKGNREPLPAPLNSFFTDDLDRIAKGLEAHNSPKLLRKVLSPSANLNVGLRKDVRDVKDISEDISKILHPVSFSLGRWPSNLEYALNFSQQVAVNNARLLTEGGGAYSVNGPPGTGKTTLLKDVFASVIVDRAIQLSKLKSPKSGFTKKIGGWDKGKYKRKVHTIKKSLTGHEMLVSSYNGKAVDNIVDDIPSVDSIAPEFLSMVDYFPELAKAVTGKECWGLVAGKLGNQSNVKKFLGNFLWSECFEVEGDEDPVRFLDYLKQYKSKKIAAPSWSKAKSDFLNKLKQAETLQAKAAEPYANSIKLIEKNNDKKELECELLTAFQFYSAIEKSLFDERDALGQIQIQHKKLLRDLTAIQVERPEFWANLCSFFRLGKEWNNRYAKLESDIALHHHSLEIKQSEVSSLELKLSRSQDKKREQEESLGVLKQEVLLLERYVSKDKTRLKADYLFNWGEGNEDEEREKSSPWRDKEWDQARSELMIAALHLQKAFILNNAGVFASNLLALSDVLNKDVPHEAEASSILAAWQTLFLVIPVISTTLASVQQLFSRIGSESFGWGFYDESGQISAPASMGLLWRVKRALVVGDPLQLEPIISLPEAAQKTIAEHYQVEPTWFPSFNSFQELADRVNPYGTYLDTDNGEVWLGSPLRVHRRCEDPMFSISNRIAYDLMMFSATIDKKLPDIPESCWANVKQYPDKMNNHWNPDDGAMLKRLINTLVNERGISPDDMFIISPFKAVATEAWSVCKGEFGFDMDCGTIHITQGQERDYVVIVLGGRTPGARAWATGAPNMLNVAVSRAKRRLYIIGDYEIWGQLPYFNVISKVQGMSVVGLQTDT